MGDWWRDIAGLIGRPLHTITAETFQVTAVQPNILAVVPQGGYPRVIQRRDIQLARRLQLTGTPLTPADLKQGGVGDKHTAYIVGILRDLPIE